MRGHSNYVSRFILSNNKIITASGDQTLKIWNTHKSDAIATLVGHRGAVESVHSDGIRVVSGSGDGEARLWDFGTGLCTSQYPHGGTVTSVLFDENHVYTGGSNARLKVWDVRTGQEAQNFGGHVHGINDIKLDDHGRIVGCSSDSVKVWDLRAAPVDNRIYLGPEPARNLNVYSSVPGGNCFQVSRNNIVVGGADGRVHVHSPLTNQQRTFPASHVGPIQCIQSDGSKVVTGGADSLVKVWDLENSTLLKTLADHKGPVHGVQFDNSKVVSCSADNTVKVWKMDTGQRLYSLLGGSLQARANNPPHPTKPGASGVVYDESSVIAAFNSLVRVYSFEPTPPQV